MPTVVRTQRAPKSQMWAGPELCLIEDVYMTHLERRRAITDIRSGLLWKRYGLRGDEEEVQLCNNEENWRGTIGEREISTKFWKTEDKWERAEDQTKEKAVA